ncbi:unnamed protein product [Gulo gulo]|uniref:Uncharacterized protein n=1 Tax=Gulo gulo TaxID=48420 RepID=A0A9X9Q295_GULGU|nr:unnamed protein product [Gulo gulo]
MPRGSALTRQARSRSKSRARRNRSRKESINGYRYLWAGLGVKIHTPSAE